MTETQRKAFDAFAASAKAWFTMEAEVLGWHLEKGITCMCKTYQATFFDDVEDGTTCVNNRLVLEIGVFMDCERSPLAKCGGCSDVYTIYYSVGVDDSNACMMLAWEAMFNQDPFAFMPDFFQWDGNAEPEIEDEEDATQ